METFLLQAGVLRFLEICHLSQEQLRTINTPTIVSPQSLLGIHGVEMNCIGNKASYTLALDFAYSSEQLFTNVIG